MEHRDMPYGWLALRLRPYRRLILAISILGILASFTLEHLNGPKEWEGILSMLGFLFWGFFLIWYWFDPDKGSFTRPLHPVLTSVFMFHPVLFAIGVTIFILVCLTMLVVMILGG